MYKAILYTTVAYILLYKLNYGDHNKEHFHLISSIQMNNYQSLLKFEKMKMWT